MDNGIVNTRAETCGVDMSTSRAYLSGRTHFKVGMIQRLRAGSTPSTEVYNHLSFPGTGMTDDCKLPAQKFTIICHSSSRECDALSGL